VSAPPPHPSPPLLHRPTAHPVSTPAG
jgi:hypothetical protein